jgi:hypothetical protein
MNLACKAEARWFAHQASPKVVVDADPNSNSFATWGARIRASCCGALMLVLTTSTSAAADSLTNGQLMQLCRTDADACRKQAERHAKATAAALTITEVQTGQCILELPKDISGETLADVAIDYVERNGPDSDEDVTMSFMYALLEKYPCPG